MEAHKQDAEWALAHAKIGLGSFTPAEFAVYAQAEATLALVEQQRIANLIALETVAGNIGGFREGEPGYFIQDSIKNALEVN